MSKHGADVVSTADEVDGMYYNGRKTVKQKSQFAFQHLGGVFVWEAGQDTVHSATSLLQVVFDARSSKIQGRGQGHKKDRTSKHKRKRKRKRKRKHPRSEL